MSDKTRKAKTPQQAVIEVVAIYAFPYDRADLSAEAEAIRDATTIRGGLPDSEARETAKVRKATRPMATPTPL